MKRYRSIVNVSLIDPVLVFDKVLFNQLHLETELWVLFLILLLMNLCE